MILARRAVVGLIIATILSLLAYYRSTSASITVKALRTSVPQVVGLGEYFDSEEKYVEDPGQSVLPSENSTGDAIPSDPINSAIPTTKPSGSTYTRNLVMARTQKEDVTWLDEVDLGPNITRMIYVADDQSAPLHPPKNKGHEVMIYLTYILDFYDDLPDVSIFMHSHRYTWHNDDLLNFDSGEMIKRLSSERVQRQGYMNMRCHWMPGCPEWIHPGQMEEDRQKLEQSLMASAWAELFPMKPIPSVLAQPCCSQFALSRDKIRSIPRERYSYYRDWLLRSEIRDTMSGRIFEYLWQVIFRDEAIFCPNQRTCYCDGFGVCFETEETFDKWFELRYHKKTAETELREWVQKAEKIEEYRKDGKLQDIEAGELQVPEIGKKEQLETVIKDLEVELEQRRLDAIQRGTDARTRAESDGRPWREGDGF